MTPRVIHSDGQRSSAATLAGVALILSRSIAAADKRSAHPGVYVVHTTEYGSGGIGIRGRGYVVTRVSDDDAVSMLNAAALRRMLRGTYEECTKAIAEWHRVAAVWAADSARKTPRVNAQGALASMREQARVAYAAHGAASAMRWYISHWMLRVDRTDDGP